jgi:peptidoglycan hydrolase-like protein with peptidoglycan-binding domain
MNHLQAKQIVDRALPSLSPGESLVVRGVSSLETSYGQWGPDALKGAGSNNMGAVTDPSYKRGKGIEPNPPSPSQFLHSDSRPATAAEIVNGGATLPPGSALVQIDGNWNVRYTTAFRKYPAPEAGFIDVAKTALRPNVKSAILTGSVHNVSSAMRDNTYYTGTLPTREANINAHAKRLSQCIADIVKATGEVNPFSTVESNAELKAGSPLACGSQSSPPEDSFSTLRLGAKGPDVVRWQGLIGAKPDGSFGLVTESLTRAKQLSLGLTPDGVVGPLTWKAAHGQEA